MLITPLLDIHPVTLEGTYVRLEPLSLDHHAGLSEVGLEKELWRWIPYAVQTKKEMREYIAAALRARRTGVDRLVPVSAN